MTTQPNAFYFQGTAMVPVPKNLWQFFSTKSQAETIESNVKALDPNTQLYDGLGTVLFIPIVYGDDFTKIWVYSGTIQAQPDPLAYSEFAGGLYDRESHPNPFVDHQGGTTLTYSKVADGLAELYWTK